jgi:Skp family chaperone for outer membrane proteins
MSKFDKLGWVVAAGVIGIMVGSGFQNSTVKIATVDLEKVFNDSEYAKNQTAVLRNMGVARQGVLEYLSTYRAVKVEDAQRFRDLSLKDNPTPADKTALDSLKTTIQTDDRRFKDLQTKSNPTPDEQAALQDYNRRIQQLAALQQRWNQEFEDEIRNMQQRLRNDTLNRVRQSVNDVAKQQGQSVVFASQVAPYAANDITDEALKNMNARR